MADKKLSETENLSYDLSTPVFVAVVKYSSNEPSAIVENRKIPLSDFAKASDLSNYATNTALTNAVNTLDAKFNNYPLNTAVVHNTGDETIGGTKTFMNNIFKKNNNSDASIIPSSNIYTHFIILRDKNNQDMSFIRQEENTNGYTFLSIFASKGTGSNRKYSQISVGVNSEGNSIAYAPTPKLNDYGDEIATTFFVKNLHQQVNVLPANPDSNVFYYIPE